MKKVFIIHEDLTFGSLIELRNKYIKYGVELTFINLKYYNRAYAVKYVQLTKADVIVIFDECSMRVNDIDYLETNLACLDIEYFSSRRLSIVYSYFHNVFSETL